MVSIITCCCSNGHIISYCAAVMLDTVFLDQARECVCHVTCHYQRYWLQLLVLGAGLIVRKVYFLSLIPWEKLVLILKKLVDKHEQRELQNTRWDREEMQWLACNKRVGKEGGNETKALGLNTSMKAD